MSYNYSSLSLTDRPDEKFPFNDTDPKSNDMNEDDELTHRMTNNDPKPRDGGGGGGYRFGSDQMDAYNTLNRKKQSGQRRARDDNILPDFLGSAPCAFFNLLTKWVLSGSNQNGKAETFATLSRLYGDLRYCDVHQVFVETIPQIIGIDHTVIIEKNSDCHICWPKHFLSLYQKFRTLQHYIISTSMETAEKNWKESAKAAMKTKENSDTPPTVAMIKSLSQKEAYNWMFYECVVWEIAWDYRKKLLTSIDIDKEEFKTSLQPFFTSYSKYARIRRKVQPSLYCDIHNDIGDAVPFRDLQTYNNKCFICINKSSIAEALGRDESDDSNSFSNGRETKIDTHRNTGVINNNEKARTLGINVYSWMQLPE